MNMIETLRDRTITDFGEQWTQYQEIGGYFGSLELLKDFFNEVFDIGTLQGARVADIGSGNGRIVRMLLDAGAAHVTAIEPSGAFDVMQKNLRDVAERVTMLRVRGDEIPEDGNYDAIFSVGVIHHIPDPRPVLEAARRALKPGGTLAIWIYGREGNRLYLSGALPLRMITRRLPHAALAALVRILDVPLCAYIGASRLLPLPMHRYMTQVMGRLAPDKRRLGIYDQLNPACAKYFTRDEAISLLTSAGFIDVRCHHRHGYSWSLAGKKPPGSRTGDAFTSRHGSA